MAKPKNKKKLQRKPTTIEMDSVFIFKLILFLILGSMWLHVTSYQEQNVLSLPVGAIIGLAFAAHDHFKIDRKIEYALLLVAMFIGFWLPMGINIIR